MQSHDRKMVLSLTTILVFTMPAAAEVTSSHRADVSNTNYRFRICPSCPGGAEENPPPGNMPWSRSHTVHHTSASGLGSATSTGSIESGYFSGDRRWSITAAGQCTAQNAPNAPDQASSYAGTWDEWRFTIDSEMQFRLEGLADKNSGAGRVQVSLSPFFFNGDIILDSGQSTDRLEWDAQFGAAIQESFEVRGRLTPGTYEFYVEGFAGTSIGPGGSADNHYLATADLTLSSCFADLNGDLQSDVFDLLLYLDHWFAGDRAAERTRDDPAAIDVFDLVAYLDDWFAGC